MNPTHDVRARMTSTSHKMLDALIMSWSVCCRPNSRQSS